jgi:hypothetical protein
MISDLRIELEETEKRFSAVFVSFRFTIFLACCELRVLGLI